MTNFVKSGGAIFLRRLIKFFCVICLFVFCFSSCTVTRQGNYFRSVSKDTTITLVPDATPELKIKKGDMLAVSISSMNKMEDEMYNSVSLAGREAGGASLLVDADGNITLHRLGKVKAEGLTRKELKLYLEKQLEPYLKDPIVSISFSNHHITLVGEITKPQIIELSNDKVSLIDALSMSGSFTTVADLKDIMVIRDKDNMKEFKHINLEDHSVFSSPFYYLQPNDIVVVNRDEKMVRQQIKREQYQQYSALVLQTISIAILIYQVFIRR